MLDAISAGNRKASDELLPLVYQELRKLAASQMRRESPGHTLQPTALVHDAYLRLVGSGEVAWDNRGHFFGAAALAMRRILVERARARGRLKRGGDRAKADFAPEDLAAEPEATDLLSLEDALQKLLKEDRRRHDVVMLRYFAGLTNDQTASAMGVSSATVRNDWTLARAWLRREMRTAAMSEGDEA